MVDHLDSNVRLDVASATQNSKSGPFFEAIRQGSLEAIAAHGAAGHAIPVLSDGQVVWVNADELLEKSCSHNASE